MVERAQKDYPNGSYTVASSINFSSKLNQKFSVILISMLFLIFNKESQIIKTLKECQRVLKKGGRIIIGVPHPNFDCYMRKGLFGLDYVETNFTGYFNSAAKMLIHKDFANGELTFNDHHWTLTDYTDSINKAGLKILNLDEFPPTNASKEFTNEKSLYPTYLVISCG